jgi:hypothetical protein
MEKEGGLRLGFATNGGGAVMVVKEWVAHQHSSGVKTSSAISSPNSLFEPRLVSIFFLLHFPGPRHSKFSDISRPGQCRAVSVSPSLRVKPYIARDRLKNAALLGVSSLRLTLSCCPLVDISLLGD